MKATTFLAALLAVALPGSAQSPIPEATEIAGEPRAPTDRGASTNKGFYLEGWKKLVPDLLSDQKRIWLFPAAAARGRHLTPALAVAGTTAALVALDPYGGRYFQRTDSFGGFNRVFSGYNTARGMILFPTALYAVGLLQKDAYAQQTYVLAAEAVLDSEMFTSAMKDVTRRLNPGLVPPGGDFSATWFRKKNGSWIRGIGSFPSGHTIAAFSLATVYARRYPHPAWRRWAAYGLAGVVGFSRVSLETHFVSDVFAGAALGYFIARDVVLRRP
jgi:membrane-associated phospholipid phosphatase